MHTYSGVSQTSGQSIGMADRLHENTRRAQDKSEPARERHVPSPSEHAGLLSWPWRRVTLNIMIVTAGVLFYLGINEPIVKLTQLYMFTDTHSLTSAVQALYLDREFFLAGVVLVFSILLPALKLFYLFVLAALSTEQLRAQEGLIERLESIGKWSMHDVLILALTIVYLKSTGLSEATSQPGAWYFAASVMLIMLSYGWIKQSAQMPRSARTATIQAPPLAIEFSAVRRFIITLFTLAAVATLALGLFLPTIELSTMRWWREEHSIISAVWALWNQNEPFLAILIFLFSVLFPILKLFYLLVITNFRAKNPHKRKRDLKWIAWLGKWSMMDVLVLALLIFYVNASAMAQATAREGIYYFTASVVLTMIAYMLVKGGVARGARKAERAHAKQAV